MVRTKKLSQWTYDELAKALVERLCRPVNGPQLRLLLDQIEVKPTEDPEEIMAKIEEVAHRADSTVSEEALAVWSRMKFCDLIKPQVSMYFYVERNLGTSNDPYRALQLAKEYVREKGHETKAMQDFLQQQLTDMGVKTNLNKSISESAPDLTAKPAESASAEVYARFLAKDTELSSRDMIYRLNDIERRLQEREDKGPKESYRRNRDGDRRDNRRDRRDYDSYKSRSASRYSDRGRDRQDSRRGSAQQYDPSRKKRWDKKPSKRDDKAEGAKGEDKSEKPKRRFHDDFVIRVFHKDELSDRSDTEADTSEDGQQSELDKQE